MFLEHDYVLTLDLLDYRSIWASWALLLSSSGSGQSFIPAPLSG
jgi:hypothetical protein